MRRLTLLGYGMLHMIARKANHSSEPLVRSAGLLSSLPSASMQAGWFTLLVLGLLLFVLC